MSNQQIDVEELVQSVAELTRKLSVVEDQLHKQTSQKFETDSLKTHCWALELFIRRSFPDICEPHNINEYHGIVSWYYDDKERRRAQEELDRKIKELQGCGYTVTLEQKDTNV